ncbi:MAG: autotransporter-associated beta strand repeat-containing protein, partial [Pseudomonadota bacterium]
MNGGIVLVKAVRAATSLLRCTALVAAVAACLIGVAQANPTNPTVISGAATFAASGKSLNVTNTPGAIINWQGFSVKADELTRFIQQNAQSAVLNRVTSQEQSAILGQLLSNGRVYLINPNGITIGAGARIDTAGFVASSLNLSDSDALAGKFKLHDTGSSGKVINNGTITTTTGGFVYLIAPDVENNGIITSPKGDIILAAGKSVELVDSQKPELRVLLTAPENTAINVGKMIAEAGSIGIFAGTIKQSGLISANSAVVGENGKIMLKAKKDITLDAGSKTEASGPQGGSITIQSDTGTASIAGAVEANGTEGKGGTIAVAAPQGVTVEPSAHITANGTEGGSVTLTSTAGPVTVAAPVTANASLGRAGEVAVSAATTAALASTGRLSASGGQSGGVVSVKGSGGVTLDAGSVVQASGAAGGSVTVQADQGAVEARGTIDVTGNEDAGGNIQIAARSDITLDVASQLLAGGRSGGEVRIESGEGTLLASGLIDAQGKDGPGGRVWLLAPRVGLINESVVNVSGGSGGGTVLVGGNFHGAGPEHNASMTYVGSGASINADAITSGNGGQVAVWSDKSTQFLGSISARGGANSGDGGFVETSGKQTLWFAGLVDTTAAHGKTGTLLLDPTNITISDAADTGTMVNTSLTPDASSNTFADIVASPSNLNTGTLETQLGLTNVVVDTTSGLVGPTGTITVQDSIAWNSVKSLTLNAAAGITVDATNLTGGAALSIANASTGGVVFTAGSTAAINGSVSTLGAVTVNAPTGFTQGTASTITTGTGLTVNVGAASAASGVIAGAGGLTKLGAGTVTLSGANTYTGKTIIENGTVSVASINSVSGGVGSSNLGAPVTVGNGTIDLGSTTTTGTLLYTGGGETTDRVINLAGTTGGGTIDQSGTGLLKFTSAFTATGAGSKTLTLQGSTASTGEIAGAIVDSSGATALTKAGTDTWTLSGANIYTGVTTINEGTLVVGADAPSGSAGALGNAASAVLLGDTTGSASAMLLTGGAFTVGRDVTVQAGNSGTMRIGGNTAASSTFSGGVTLNKDVTLMAVSGTTTFSGVISGAGGVSKTGGGTVYLNQPANTYTGATWIAQGTLQADKLAVGGANSSLGATAAGTAIVLGDTSNAATLEYMGTSGDSSDRQFSVAGGSSTGTINASNAGFTGLTLSGAMANAGGLTFNVTNAAGVLSASGVISGAGAVTKAGGGTLVLSGANSYAGTTTVSAGTLKLGAANVIPDGSGNGNVSVTGTLDLGGFSETINGLTGGGTVDNSVAGGPYTLTVGSNDAISSFGGVITDATGTLALTKTGTGTLTLTGANTYSGTTTISAGTLQVGDGGTTGTLGNSAVTDNGTLAFNRSDSILMDYFISGSGALTQAGSGTLTLRGTNTYSGGTTISAGTLAVGNGGTAGQLGGGAVTNNGTLLRFQRADSITVNNAISGTGALTYTGGVQNDGNTLTLGGANTYTGATTVDGTGPYPVTLKIGASNVLPNTTAVTVTRGATLDLNNYNNTIGSLTLQSDTSTASSVTTGAGTLTLGGNVTLNSTGTGATGATVSGNLDLGGATRTFTIANGNAADDLLISAVVSGTDVGLNKAGTGTLTFSGANTYTGSTSITAGTLSVTNAAGINTGSALTVNGGTLDINNITLNTLASANIQGTGAAGVGALTGTGAGAVYAGPITLDGATTIGGAGTLTLNGIVDGGAVALTKVGAGTLALGGANTYSGGTNVNGGTLQLGASGVLADAGAVTLADAALVVFDVNGKTETIGTLTGGGGTGGNISLGAGALTVTQGADGTYAGVISGTGASSLTKAGANTLTLSGANTYTGATTVSAGTLELSGAGSITSSGVGVTGAILKLTSVINAVPVTLNAAATLRGSGTSTQSGLVTLGGAATIDTVAADTLNLTGGITTGVNTLTLAGANGSAIDVNSDVSAAALTVSATSQNILLRGSANTITNTVTFANTGALTLGQSVGTLTFDGGLVATAPSSRTLLGTIQSSN